MAALFTLNVTYFINVDILIYITCYINWCFRGSCAVIYDWMGYCCDHEVTCIGIPSYFLRVIPWESLKHYRGLHQTIFAWTLCDKRDQIVNHIRLVTNIWSVLSSSKERNYLSLFNYKAFFEIAILCQYCFARTWLLPVSRPLPFARFHVDVCKLLMVSYMFVTI